MSRIAATLPGLYRLGSGDIEAGKGVLFQAFRNDPFFSYLYRERSGDEQAVSAMHRFVLAAGIRYGEVYAPSPELEGIAVWLPPGRARITTSMALLSGVMKLRIAFGSDRHERIRFFRRMISFSDYSENLHHRLAPFPHWYLWCLGVADRYRGQGFASCLLRPMFDRLDAENLPCYLETHNPDNISLYGHFGFELAEEGRIPGTDTLQWSMLRKPRQGAVRRD